MSQIIESVHFYSCLEAKLSPRFLSLSPRKKKITHSSRAAFFEDLFFPQQKGGGVGGGIMSRKNYQNEAYEGIGHKL